MNFPWKVAGFESPYIASQEDFVSAEIEWKCTIPKMGGLKVNEGI